MSVEHDLELDDKISLRLPKQYKVILLNDDYTSMDFVVAVLMGIFHKNYKEAEVIMLLIHETGRAVCGIYSFEIAETKVAQVHQLARQEGFPLKAIMEEL
jgi:ATP-dependent Clp protease adaptor protein ClpS